MSPLFHIIENESVILLSGGVFTQTTAYTRKGELYAKKGGGFIRMIDGGGTSHPSTRWVDTTLKGMKVVEHGRLVVK